MKKKIVSLILGVMLIISAVGGLVGCGGGGGGGIGLGAGTASGNTLRFWYYGDDTQQTAIEAMVNAYNAGPGKEAGINVMASNRGESSYISEIERNTTTSIGPDVYYAWDRMFKKWTSLDMTVDLTEYAEASIAKGELNLDEIWDSTVTRFRYDKELDMSRDNAPIYGLPIDTSPTGLYYNIDAMEAVGVKVISVPEEDLADWNNNLIADRYGHKKADLGIPNDLMVPAKGYFRDDDGTRIESRDGNVWGAPVAGTVCVFNDEIAMNWDEIEDLSFLLTKRYNPASTTTHGYYTEWWFNYGWAVGGDCVEDISGNGSWVYTHGDRSANYIVNEGMTYVGAITGKTYQAGETLEFLDKVDVEEGDEITQVSTGGYQKNGADWSNEGGNITNDSITRPAVLQAVADGTLTELPSIREAFTRFVKLAGMSEQDLNICPYPNDITTGTSINHFASGKVAMIVERAINLAPTERYVAGKFDWAMAKLPVYKEYDRDPDSAAYGALIDEYGNRADAYNTNVKRQGKIAGHSESTALVIRPVSEKKDQAWHFICWMVGPDAQKIKAQNGYVPNQESLVEYFYDSVDPKGTDGNRKKNLANMVEATGYETPGDWWYMIDREWINIWANPLNWYVRNGELSLEEFFNTYVDKGSEDVYKYGNWDDGMNLVTAGNQ